MWGWGRVGAEGFLEEVVLEEVVFELRWKPWKKVGVREVCGLHSTLRSSLCSRVNSHTVRLHEFGGDRVGIATPPQSPSQRAGGKLGSQFLSSAGVRGGRKSKPDQSK